VTRTTPNVTTPSPQTWPSDADPKTIKAALRKEFPGWSIILSDRDRWWATRNPRRTHRLLEHGVTALETDSPHELRAQLLKAAR
jgi:hypothetical protein